MEPAGDVPVVVPYIEIPRYEAAIGPEPPPPLTGPPPEPEPEPEPESRWLQGQIYELGEVGETRLKRALRAGALHRLRMRIKCYDGADAIQHLGTLTHLLDELLVAPMDAVEDTDGENDARPGVHSGQTSDDSHVIVLLWPPRPLDHQTKDHPTISGIPGAAATTPGCCRQ